MRFSRSAFYFLEKQKKQIMSGTKTYHGDCLIVLVQGQPVITTSELPPLRLPGEQLPRRFSVRPIIVALIAFALWVTPTPTQAMVTPSSLLETTNSERSTRGLPQLNSDDRLNQAATAKAQDMLTQQYFSHVSPQGLRGWHWMKEAGYPYTEAGENLAMDFLDAQSVVTAWMGSAGHRQNMISTKFVDVGVATIDGIYGGKNTTVIVMLFGRQSSVSAATTVPDTSAPVPEVVTTPKPASIEQPQPVPIPIINKSAPTNLVASLVEPTGVAVPTLVFTYLPPAPEYLRPAAPVVLGLSTETTTSGVSQETTSTIATLILSALFLAGNVIGFAARWQATHYPQPPLNLAISKA